MVHSVLISNIREMNYIIGNFVFIPSSAANRNDNRTKLCSESVIKINFLTNLKESSRIEESASCNLYLGCQRGFSCAVQVYTVTREVSLAASLLGAPGAGRSKNLWYPGYVILERDYESQSLDINCDTIM